MDGSTSALNQTTGGPLWLLAELTYRCPMHCFYCSNPLNSKDYLQELTTEEWQKVLRQGRDLGAVQLGFSGGEPLLRRDLASLVGLARTLGYYTNLITSGIGLTDKKIHELREAGLDHIQLSLQAHKAELNDFIGGRKTFDEKLKAAKLIKSYGYPMVLNVVLHRYNIEFVEEIIALAESLEADYLELANTQFDGWAYKNRELLLPTHEQVIRAEEALNEYRSTTKSKLKILFVVPDYYAGRPKPCSNGWGTTMLLISPDGRALPCHGAGKLPLDFPNVKTTDLKEIWYESTAFNRFRGKEWLPKICQSCPDHQNDFGGCRCQAFLISGDMTAVDPVCSKAPDYHLIKDVVNKSSFASGTPIYRRLTPLEPQGKMRDLPQTRYERPEL